MPRKTGFWKLPILRKLSIAQSVILIVIAAIAFFDCAANDNDAREKSIILSLLAAFFMGQAFNIIVHLIDPSYQTTTWLGLFIVRKKLEEKKKIEALSGKK